MSTKKKISDIDKAIEEMQQRRDECFKHIGKAMYESCPELGDMSVADMRKAGRYLHKMLAKKPNKERTVQVRFSDEELAALDAICSEKKMTRSAFLRSCVEKVQGGDVEPTYVVTRNADAERMASEAKSIGVNVNQIARALNAESKSRPGSLSPGVLGECKTGLAEVRGELSKLTDEVDGLRTDFGKDVFRAMALLWPDVPEQLEELCDYWYGERGDKILSGEGGS